MKSPFTFKRYLFTAGCIALFTEPLLIISWFMDKQEVALWVIILIPLFIGIVGAFNIFILGEIAFRGRRHALRRHTSLRRQLVRIFIGALLMLLAGPGYTMAEALPVIGIWFWDFSESITGLMNITGFLMFVFGIGELTTHIKKTRQNKHLEHISDSASAV